MYLTIRHLGIFILALASYSTYGQNTTIELDGKIKSLNNDVSNVLVVNLNSKRSTISDSLGLFTIEARLKDAIRFTAVQYLPKEFIVTEKIIGREWVEIEMVENVIDLSEVIVTPYNLSGKLDSDIDRLGLEPAVTSSSLGLPNAGLEIMTQSERLLIEADRGKYVRLATIEDRGKLMGILGYLSPTIIVNTHKIMNRASGRTKSFEDRVARDEDMAMEKEIIFKFSKETMSQDFDIPESNIDGFLTYCLSQTDFSELSKAGNTIEIWQYLKARSIEFKETDLVKE